MPNFSKCHNSRKIRWIFFLIQSGNPLIIPYQLTKFQVPSSNNFLDILLTSLKCPNFQKAITPEILDELFLKFNQVIYSSSPISWLCFKPLAQKLFEIACWQNCILIFSKEHNSRKWDNYVSNGRTHGQPETNIPRQLLWSRGHKKLAL